MQEDPKLLPQEEATYAEPILVPTVNKTMTLTPSNIVQQQQQSNGMNGGGYSTTSPKATLRKVINNHNNTTSSNVGALFESSPSPCPSNGLYAPYSDHGNNLPSNAYPRDPYSSFRSRDAYGAGSIRSQHPHSGFAQPPMVAPMDAAPFGTLRSSNKATNLGDGYGTARSVKKVYL